MRRTVFRPSFTWITLAALVVVGAVVGARAASVSPRLAATCVGYGYGQTAPVVNFSVSPSVITARQTVSAFGWVGQNGCGLPGETVVLQRRALVNGQPTGALVTAGTATTDSDGLFAIPFTPWFNTVVRVAVPANNAHGALFSTNRNVYVRPQITVSRPAGPHTQAQVISGTVAPNKSGRLISLWRVTEFGSEYVASAYVSSSSTYRFTRFFPQGFTSLYVYLPADAVNAAGVTRFRVYRS